MSVVQLVGNNELMIIWEISSDTDIVNIGLSFAIRDVFLETISIQETNK